MDREKNIGKTNIYISTLKDILRLCSLALLISLSYSCNDEKRTSLPKKEGTLSNLMELPINTTDKEEVGNFAHVLGNYNAIKTELLTLQDSIGEGLDFDDMLPLRIKESRLQSTSTSKTGAVGLGQLQPAAIADVNRRLKKHNFTATYTPKDNPAHNLLYSTIYLSLIKQQVKDFLEAKKVEVSDTDLFLFTIASYNLGINKWKALYNNSDKASSRDDFVKYIIKDLMKLPYEGQQEIDKAYGVNYTNYFGNNNYADNKTTVFNGKYNNYPISLHKAKAQEFIRYVEIIKGLQEALLKDQKDYAEISTVLEDGLYSQIAERLKKQEEDIKLKTGSNGNPLIEKILLDNQLTMEGVDIFPEKLVVNHSIVAPYLVNKEFAKYKYSVEAYNSAEGRYLWSIVNTLIKDKKFRKSLKNGLGPDVENDDISEIRSVIRQYTMEAIVRFNQERRINWKETASNDVWIPEMKYFANYETLKNIETNLVQSEKEESIKSIEEATENIKTGTFYVDPALDALGDKIKEGPISFPVDQVYNPVLAQAERKKKGMKPTMIIIHGTESKVGDISTIKAHFYIDYEGNITQYVTSQGKTTTTISYPKEIVALNHAGWGNTQYGFSRNGDGDGTYSAIGIEVASTENSRPNAAQNKALAKLITGLSTAYGILQKNIHTHQQVATSKKFGRGRKSDLNGLDFTKIGLPNNHLLLDWDVIEGKESPNMKEQVAVLKKRGMSEAEIKYILAGLNTSILLNRKKCRENSSLRNTRKNGSDVNARSTLKELENKGYF